MADDSIECKKDAEGKNKGDICCFHCASKMLNPGLGTYIKTEFPLPNVGCKPGEEEENSELISDCWLVESVFIFENIGVCRERGNIKYLCCAECEIGPVGWWDVSTSQVCVALPRVKHQPPNS